MGYHPDVEEEVFRLFRRFRHDLLNDLQVLGGHVQMNKSREVLIEDIHTMTRRIQQLSQLFSCGDELLAVALWTMLEAATDHEVQLYIEVPRQASPAVLEWSKAVLQAGSAIISSVSSLPEQQRHIKLRLTEPLKATFVLTANTAQTSVSVPGFVVQTDATDEGLQITVSAPRGEE